MARTMYDALSTAGIPAGTQMAAWYPYDSRNTSGPPRGARQILAIDNTAGGDHPDCHIADAEPGAMGWAAVPGWVSRCTRAQPTVYASLSNTPALFSAMSAVSRHWYLWVARYLATPQPVVPPVPGLPANCTLVGCQYEAAGPYDLSIITDDNWYPLEADMDVSIQNSWATCAKCRTLVYGPEAAGYPCAAGGKHEVMPTSGNYALSYTLPYTAG